ncbi:hypothetical protein Q7C_217 [Methylophaga frappieri]|uniref:YcgL domain-containing protein n=1 Tax=Methylophaga frappieri (strain ATCC BAA-2434 / DSM 25690 / JAM7) TaxID=754477 RepID=I1YEQ5_METFJ|nr:hypothetical protein Q7C_217 [Methylophaga frappieri]
MYLLVEDDFSVVPETLLNAFEPAPEKVMTLRLSSDRPLAREDVDQVMQQLQEQGFYLQMPPSAMSLLEKERATNAAAS